MISVLSELPEIEQAALTEENGHVFLAYKFHHKLAWITPRVSADKIDLTEFVFYPHQLHNVQLYGLMPANSTDDDLDDINDGMVRITRLWGDRCNLALVVGID